MLDRYCVAILTITMNKKNWFEKLDSYMTSTLHDSDTIKHCIYETKSLYLDFTDIDNKKQPSQ